MPASGDLLGGESQAPAAVSHGDAAGPAQTGISSNGGGGGMFAGLDMFGGAAASARCHRLPLPPHLQSLRLQLIQRHCSAASAWQARFFITNKALVMKLELPCEAVCWRTELTETRGTADAPSAVAPSPPAGQPSNDLADLLADFAPPAQLAPAPAPAYGALGSTAGAPEWSSTGMPAAGLPPQQPYPNGLAARAPAFPPSAQQRPPQGSSPRGMGAAAGGLSSMGFLSTGGGSGVSDAFEFDLSRQRLRGGQGMAMQRGSSGAASMGTARPMQSEPAGYSNMAASHANGVLGVCALSR